MASDFDRPRDDDTPMPVFEVWELEEADPAAVPVVYPDAEPVWCRRCGETSVPVESCCPWCGKWIVGEPPVVPLALPDDGDEPEDDWHDRRPIARPVRRPPLVPPVVVVIVAYVALLGVSVLFLIVALARGVANQDEMLELTALVETVDAVLAAGALALVWHHARQRVPDGTMAITWAVALPVLGLLLCVNITYIHFLRELLKPFGAQEAAEKLQLTWVVVLVVCVQPGIIEELFFRQMTLGVMRRHMNLHLAVWVTAAMFAFAHLFNPLGMPYLFLAGGVFGYARVYGGLPLAMILHFLHNLAVVLYEVWK